MDEHNLPPIIDAHLLPTSTLAIVSLVSAILGFTFVPVIGTIVALITGYMARNETRSLPPESLGRRPGNCRDHHGLGPGRTLCDRHLLHDRLFCVHRGNLCCFRRTMIKSPFSCC